MYHLLVQSPDLVWLLQNEKKIGRYACDSLALSVLSEDEATNYGFTIIKLAGSINKGAISASRSRYYK